MPTQSELIQQLLKTVDDAVEKFNGHIPKQQQKVLDEVLAIVKDIDISGTNIRTSAANLKKIAQAKSRLERIIISPEYKEQLKEYMKAFNEVAKIQNQYFRTLEDSFTPNALLAEIRTQSIDATLNSLMGAGITANITEPIQNILRTNITTGASYNQLRQQLTDFLTENESSVGAMQRYTKQITTDALNQYAAQYANAVVADLELEWFTYNGALIEMSRPFCVGLIRKKYIHKSELPKIVLGDFPEFKDAGGKIYDKTGLPEGMIAGTNAENFHVYRGGYQCNHQLIPVSAYIVPIDVIMAIPRQYLGKASLKRIGS